MLCRCRSVTQCGGRGLFLATWWVTGSALAQSDQPEPGVLVDGTPSSLAWLLPVIVALAVLALAFLLRQRVMRKTVELSQKNESLQQEIADRNRVEQAARDSERRLLKQNEALVALAREEITSSKNGDASPGLRKMLETTAETLNVSRASLWLFDEFRSRIHCIDSYDARTGQHKDGQQLAKADFPRYFAAIEEDRILAADDAVIDPRTSEFATDYLKPEGISSMLDVPVRAGGRVIGVLCSEHAGPGRVWQLDEQNFCKALADFSALALESAEKRRAQENLRRSERYYRSLIENTSDIIVVIDAHGIMTHLSPSFDRILGFSPGEKIGTLCFELVHPDDVEQVQQVFAGLLTTPGAIAHARYRYQDAEGKWRYMEAVGKNLLHDDAVGSVVANVRDVTERVHAEQELAQERLHLEETVQARTVELSESLRRLTDANLRLEEANRHKGRFLSSMSHELRTPLNAILGFADLLRGQFFGPLNEKQLSYVNQLDQSGKHLLALINDLLDMAKIDAGAMDVVHERFSPHDCIDTTVNMLSSQFRRKQIEVSVDISPALTEMSGDLRKCRQIMLNLLSNAVKYTPENGRVEIVAGPDEQGDVRISVSDTGIGIAQEEQEKIFSEFHQVDRARDEQLGGTGIGLALTRRLVEQHGGTIGVESSPGAGSKFWFVLPRSQSSHRSEPEAPTPRGEIGSPEPESRDTTILVAEDNDVNLSVILDMLRTRGYQAVVARNGKEAVDMAEEHQPDLILMDIRMPVMDGLEATSRIRSITSIADTPIVALTASAGSDSEERCLAAGCSAHLAKPVQTRELFDLLGRYLPELTK